MDFGCCLSRATSTVARPGTLPLADPNAPGATATNRRRRQSSPRTAGLHELPLIEVLQREQRAFMKPLRYDAKSAVALPDALLLDCENGPLPLHAVSAFADARGEHAVGEAVHIGQPHWTWNTETEVPLLPVRGRSRLRGQLGNRSSPGARADGPVLNSVP